MVKMEWVSFDASNVTEWDKTPRVTAPRCEPVTIPCLTFQENVEASRRIGSDSSDAVVFQVETSPGCFVAAKALLFVEPNSYKAVANEIEIANYVSEAVYSKTTDRFPLVYGSQKCDRIMLPPDVADLLSSRAQAFQGTESLAGPFQGYVLFSELLWGDLSQFYLSMIEKKASLEDFKFAFYTIIGQALLAIRDLHDLGISHNDLHLGNFLMRQDGTGKFTVVIHDFGKSEFVKEWTSELVFRDLETFNSAINDRGKLRASSVASKFNDVVMKFARRHRRNPPENFYQKLYELWIHDDGSY